MLSLFEDICAFSLKFPFLYSLVIYSVRTGIINDSAIYGIFANRGLNLFLGLLNLLNSMKNICSF